MSVIYGLLACSKACVGCWRALTQSVLGFPEGGGDPCPGKLSMCLFDDFSLNN